TGIGLSPAAGVTPPNFSLADLRHGEEPVEDDSQVAQKAKRKDKRNRNREYHCNDGKGAIVSRRVIRLLASLGRLAGLRMTPRDRCRSESSQAPLYAPPDSRQVLLPRSNPNDCPL